MDVKVEKVLEDGAYDAKLAQRGAEGDEVRRPAYVDL